MLNTLILLVALPLFTLGQQQDISLDKYDGKEIAIRGYLHRAEENLWVLTPEHNTPSCCLAAPHKTTEQIFLAGSFIPSVHPVTIQGLLKVNESHPQFILIDPTITETDKKSFPWISFSLGVILLGVVSIIKFRTKRKNSLTAR